MEKVKQQDEAGGSRMTLAVADIFSSTFCFTFYDNL